MQIAYSNHAKKRMMQRGLTLLEVQHVLEHPMYIKKLFEGREEAVGSIKNRQLKIIYTMEKPNYIRIITVL